MTTADHIVAHIVADLAQRFVSSWRRDIWDYVASDIRGALIDSLIIEALRAAQAAGGDFTVTPQTVLEWRSELVKQLAAGVRQPGRGRRAFTIE